MSNCCIRKHHPTAGVFPFVPHRFTILLSLLIAAWFAVVSSSPAAESDEIYLKIYNLIEQGDDLADKAKPTEAITKYAEAQKQLKEFKQTFPTYNAKTVNYRLNYLAGKIDTLSHPAPTTENNSGPATTAAVKHATAGGPEVKLLDAGAEPRQVVRLHAKPMEVQKAKISVRMGMGFSAAGQAGEMMKLPEMIITANITTKNVSPEGDVAYEVVIEEFNAAPQPGQSADIANAVKASLAAMKGLTVKGVMTDRYFSKKIEVQIPPNADPQTRASMEQMKDSFANARFVLPEEALGVGGKWEVKQKAKKQGMLIDETVRHEVVSLEGDTLVVKSSTILSATNQKIPSPMMPTLKVDLTKMSGTATETATVDLSKTLPTKATASEQSEINMSMTNAGKKQVMTMKTETHSTLETE